MNIYNINNNTGRIISYYSKNLIVALLFCSIHLICFCQDNSFKFRRLTIEEGLSQSSVSSIAQDKEGFMWFATANGLNRYDGYEFKVYRNEIDNDSSLSNNRLEKIYIDSKNRLWVGTEGNGLNLFKNKYDSFTKIQLNQREFSSIRAIYESMDDRLWIGTRNGGLYQIEVKDEDSLSTTHYPIILNNDLIKSDIKDIVNFQNKLVLGTFGDGIIFFDQKKRKFLRYQGAYQDLLNKCYVNSLYIDSKQRLWVATDGTGMIVIDKKYTMHIDYQDFGLKGLLSNDVYTLIEDQEGYLWVGTKGGLNISTQKMDEYEDLKSISFSKHVFSPSNPKSLSNNFVLSFFEDQSGLVWIGTSADGVNLYNRGSELFNYFQKMEGIQNSLENETIMSVYDDEQGRLWIGSDEGLIKFDKQKKTFKNFENNVGDLSFMHKSIMSITELERGKLLLGTYGSGLVIFDIFKEQFTQLINEEDYALKFSHRILTTYKDTKGVIWVGTDGDGIIKFRFDNNTKNIKYKQYKHIPNDLNSISHNDIWKFFEDQEGKFWIGTVGGLNQYHPDKDEFTRYEHIPYNKKSLSSNRVYTINNLGVDKLLIGTDNGLNAFEKSGTPPEGKFERFTEKEGLSNQVIYGILQESDNIFWLSTNNGISRFDYINQVFENYSTSDGIPSNEFNTGAYFKNSNGELFFGSTKGLLWFDPEKIQTLVNRYIPPIVISEIEIKGIGSIFDTNTEETIYLKHNQNTITLSVAALDFTSPSKNQFAYMLDPLDDDWVYLGNTRTISYNNLRPGKYQFMVKGSNNDGIWNEEPTIIYYTIQRPWWVSWWAYSIYVLGLVGLGFWYYRFNLGKKIAIAEMRKIKEIDDFKSKMFANISHEFRTPLTLIKGFSSLLANNNLSKKEEELLEGIQDSNDQLLNLVNQMLDLAALDADRMELHYKNGDVIKFIKKSISLYKSYTDSNLQKIIFNSSVEELFMDFDDDKLQKILNNLVSNAVKFTPGGGTISIKIQKENNQLILKVSDTGKGIEKPNLDQVFERHFKTYDIDGNEGAGIGLALTKDLVTLMEGSITVESEQNTGTTFTVTLPIKNQAVNAEIDYHLPFIKGQVNNSELIREAKSNGSMASVLVVEDNRDIQKVILLILSDNYNITLAKNGIEGLKIASSKTIDFIISDVMMPEMDGFEFCKRIKSNINTSHIPFIMLSARTHTKDKQEAYKLGVDAYLTKPFNGEELQLIIGNLLNKQRERIDYFKDLLHLKKEHKNVPSNNDLDIKLMKDLQILVLDPNTKYSISQLSKKLYISRAQLHRKIVALTGMSTTKYINFIRIEKSKELLSKTNLQVKEVAYSVGFESTSYFSRLFKKELGITPETYANKA